MPIARPTSIVKLQTIQNAAPRVATGCYAAASTQHLLSESLSLSVKDHLNLMSTQFLANAMRELHPSHETVSRPPGPRQKKATLQVSFGHRVAPFIRDGVVSCSNCKKVLTALHTTTVKDSISSLGPNRVLGIPPPQIHASERLLPCAYHTTLSQLRSGFCKDLETYQQRIGKSPNDICPDCLAAPQSTAHLFSCAETPTDLEQTDLWSCPCEVAFFLASLSTFSHLPPLDPPPPEPPPNGADNGGTFH